MKIKIIEEEEQIKKRKKKGQTFQDLSISDFGRLDHHLILYIVHNY